LGLCRGAVKSTGSKFAVPDREQNYRAWTEPMELGQAYQDRRTMNTSDKTSGIKDMQARLSTLWIFTMLNYLYADVYGLYFNPVLQKEQTKEFLTGYVGAIQITQDFVLITAILMETAIAMVLLSRVLKYSANRWTNIAAGLFHTAFVSWSLFVGTAPNLFYIFFAAIEIASTLFIAGYAWKWRNPEASPVI
jgi:hypothetical protein